MFTAAIETGAVIVAVLAAVESNTAVSDELGATRPNQLSELLQLPLVPFQVTFAKVASHRKGNKARYSDT